MKKTLCPLENKVMEGLREQTLTPELQNHVSGCPICRDLAAVHGWMSQFKKESWTTGMPKKDLPTAQTVWDKAFARKKPDKRLVTKAMRPLIIPQVLSFAVFFAGSIFLGIKGILRFGNILDSPAAARIFPFFLVLISMAFLSVAFCGLLLALEKRKRPV